MPRHVVVLSVATVCTLLAGLSGVAYAYWSSSATGSGTASAGTAATVSLASGTPTTFLYPGTNADVVTTVTNPNPYNVIITGLSAGTITSNSGTCDTNGSGVSFNVPGSYPAGTYTVPAKAGVGGSGVPAYVLTIAGGASMTISSDNACQGKTFSIPLSGTATATS